MSEQRYNSIERNRVDTWVFLGFFLRHVHHRTHLVQGFTSGPHQVRAWEVLSESILRLDTTLRVHVLHAIPTLTPQFLGGAPGHITIRAHGQEVHDQEPSHLCRYLKVD